MLICVSFGIRKVRRLLYFGSSLFALCSMPIHPIYTYISTLKSFWFEKHEISPPESDWEIPDSKEHKTHVTMHILSHYWRNPSRFHQAGRQAGCSRGRSCAAPADTSWYESLHCLSCWLAPREACTDTHQHVYIMTPKTGGRGWEGCPSFRLPPSCSILKPPQRFFFLRFIKHAALAKPKSFDV